MPGVAGRSGRVKKNEEVKIADLAKLVIKWGVDSFNDFTREEKMRILLVLAPKYIPQAIEGSAQNTNVIVIRHGDKAEELARSLCVQQETKSGDVQCMGDREEHVFNLAGHALQRANT